MTIEEMNKIKTELGFSYMKIAEISGLPLSTVQKVLGGITKSPRHDTLKALEKALCPVSRADSGRQSSSSEKYPNQERSASSREASHPDSDDKYYYDPASYGRSFGMVREALPEYGSSPKKQGDYTISDYLNMPDDIRVELIDGVIFDMGAPILRHQVIAGRLYYRITQFIDAHGGSCIPFIAPVDVQLDCDEKTMVQPDVLIVCDPQKYREGKIFGAPDFAAEVISPSTRRKDYILKLKKYFDAGVKEYWIIDPSKERVIVYNFTEEAPLDVTMYSFEDKVPMALYNGDLVIDFTDIKHALQKLET